MEPADVWIAGLELAESPRGATLVLCRSRATVARIRRWIADRGGMLGVDVTTPAGLVRQLATLPFVAPPPVDVAHPMLARVGARPGLLATLREHVQRARLARIASGDRAGQPPWLVELADTGWGSSPLEPALERLLRHGPPAPGYARVVSVGLGGPGTEPWAVALASRLGARAYGREMPPRERIPARLAPDVAAEARVAAAWIAARGADGALVLVSERATALRVRDALRRSRIPAAFVETAPLAAHPLAQVVQQLAGWLAAPDPSLRITEIERIVGRAGLGSGLPARAEDAVAAAGGSASFDRRYLVRLLERCRLLDAPLSRWLARTAALAEGLPPTHDREDAAEEADSLRRQAVRLHALLRVVDARARGVGLDAVFAAPIPGAGAPDGEADPENAGFEDAVRDVLGDGVWEPTDDAPAAGTIGAVRRLALDLRVRFARDPVARSLLASLRDLAALPVDRIADALDGVLDPREIGAGVEILTYDEYDGRPCRSLVLLDVHDKGLARRPARDAFLDDAALARLGVLAGRAAVEHRLDRLRSAAAAAGDVLAVLTRRDASGRAVVHPHALALDITDARVPAYGLGLPGLPEDRARRRLRVRRAVGGPVPDAPLDPLALQASLEWYRAGRGPLRGPGMPADRRARLDHHHAAALGALPEWALPWLGDAGPAGALPDREWSVTRLIRPLTHCGWQAFAGVILGVRESDTASEELDPREVGTAVHAALEAAGAGIRWRAPDDQVGAARAHAVDELVRASDHAFHAAKAELAGLSPARLESVDGRGARWASHWTSYAEGRIRSERDGPTDEILDLCAREHPATLRALAALRANVPEHPLVSDTALLTWLMRAARDASRGDWARDPEQARNAGDRDALPEAWGHSLLAFVARRAGTPFCRMAEVIWRLHQMGDVLARAVDQTWVEVGFGADAHRPGDLGPVTLRLGDQELAVQGRIDRITRVGPWLQVVDYKSGGAKPEKDAALWGGLVTLKDPQLVVYALALLAAADRLAGIPADSRADVAAVGWDHVRHTRDDKRKPVLARDQFLLERGVTDELGAALGRLVAAARAGRWPLRPRPDTCPKLAYQHDKCPYSSACRFRGLPEAG